MTQGAPVLAGMSNTATDTTEIAFGGAVFNYVLTLSGVSGTGLLVTGSNPTSGPLGVASFPMGPHADAVYAVGGGRGVYAVGHNGVGVNAYSYTDIGTNSYGALTGVKGSTVSSTGAGVWGTNTAGPGVLGTSDQGIGVLGTSEQGIGVKGIANGGKRPMAILGANASGSADGVAVVAEGGAGVGLDASGERAAIRLNPAKKRGPPTTGVHSMGEMMVDRLGNLFFCKAGGTPGTWVRVA